MSAKTRVASAKKHSLDSEIHAGTERARVGGEEQRGPFVLPRLRNSVHGVAVHPAWPVLRFVCEQRRGPKASWSARPGDNAKAGLCTLPS
jgi:hypothetical protein